MSQGDYNIQNQGFPAFRSDLNSTLSAINSSNSGTSRPSSAVAGTVWLDTTSATTPTLKFFDGTDDISLATLDYTANTVNWLDSTVVADLVNDTTPQLGGSLDVNGNSIVSVSNGNITFTPDGTGKVIIDGLSHPTSDGTAGQFMKTDGSGNLSFDTVDLTNLSATNLTSGTIPNARYGTPTFDGSNLTNLPSGGKLLQVVTATDSSLRTTTSTSFVTASNTLSVDITPSSASSKIFIIYSTAIYMDSNNNRIYTTLYRDSTNLGDSSRGLNSLLIGDNDLCVPCSHSILDSPSTASQVTYQVYIKVSGSTGYFNTDGAGGAGGSITVFEIGA